MDTLNILYEDSDILVCVKPNGLPTQTRDVRTPDLESILKNHIAKNLKDAKSSSYLGVIHRLDQPVSGILVFAKTPFAAKELNRQLRQKGFHKYYYALVEGRPPQEKGVLEHHLVKDGRSNTSRLSGRNDPGAKAAKLTYTVLSSTGDHTLLEIRLDTGRHHQIRVQMAAAGCPIQGDTKYNPKAYKSNDRKTLKLCAYKLVFSHPRTKKRLQFELERKSLGW